MVVLFVSSQAKADIGATEAWAKILDAAAAETSSGNEIEEYGDDVIDNADLYANYNSRWNAVKAEVYAAEQYETYWEVTDALSDWNTALDDCGYALDAALDAYADGHANKLEALDWYYESAWVLAYNHATYAIEGEEYVLGFEDVEANLTGAPIPGDHLWILVIIEAWENN